MMTVKFWGTRGSIATPGSYTMKYGGNTPCLEIRVDNQLLIFDAGTGLRDLGMTLINKSANEFFLFLTHTHWDHIQGFPFFSPAYMKSVRLNVFGPAGRDKSLEQIFRTQFDTDYHPVSFSDLSPNIVIQEMEAMLTIGKITITTHYLNHPAMCLAYKISSGDHSVVLATDNEPYQYTLEQNASQASMPIENFPVHMDDKLVRFIEGTDLFIGDAQFTLAEYQYKKGWGHSPVDHTVQTALKGKVKRCALFHHDPFHDDAFVDGMVAHAQKLVSDANSPLDCFGAREGQTVQIG